MMHVRFVEARVGSQPKNTLHNHVGVCEIADGSEGYVPVRGLAREIPPE
jgi:hypothetical protein